MAEDGDHLCKVFISYSHADSDWLERLQTMLVPLQQQGALDVWADTRIQPGQLWKEEIQKALAMAKVAVLLVSPDFLASEFIHQNELQPLLEASRKEGLTILWIPVRPSLYSETAIAHYQAAHNPRTPLSTLTPAQQETALVVIAKKLMAIRFISSPVSALPLAPAPSPPTILIPEQVLQTSSSPPTLTPSSLILPPQPSETATTRYGWKPLLVGVMLGILSGTGVYYVGHKWFELRSFTTPLIGTKSVQPPSPPALPKTTTPKPPPDVTVTPPPQQTAGAKLPPLPLVQNIHGWSAPQVQDLQTQTTQALNMKVEFRDNLKDGSQGPLMVVIPAGRFQMGSPETELGRGKDEHQHEVEVATFAIGKYEVTMRQFKQFVQVKGYRIDAESENNCNWRNAGFPQIDEHPVVCASWDDAMAYVGWLSAQTGQHYRLPTEAEWEYAARAGTRTAYYWGDNRNEGCAYANVADQTALKQFPKWAVLDCQDGYIFTAPVGHYLANAFGLHDMLGNVWEWTCSEYDKDYSGGEQRCVSDMSQTPRVLRGGSWNFNPPRVRTAARDWLYPQDRRLFGGFRLARTFSP